MTAKRPELFCSAACENAMLVRSVGTCPECGKTWNGQSQGDDRHYRNNAWKICDTCSRLQNRCVKCGLAIAGRQDEVVRQRRPLLLRLMASVLIFLAIVWAIGACLASPFSPAPVVLAQFISALTIWISFVGLLRMRRWSPRVFFVSWPIILAIAVMTARPGDAPIVLGSALAILLLYFLAWSPNRAKFT